MVDHGLASVMVLTPDEMKAADRAADASAISTYDLMERAGQAIASTVSRSYPEAMRFVALCGPGNNGGDGYVAARTLSDYGLPVTIYHASEPDRLRGDAALARRSLARQTLRQPALTVAEYPIAEYQPQPGDVVIDALFGAGLSRALSGDVANVIRRITEVDVPVVAVDLPSGVCGRRGTILGTAFAASMTITFAALKPGHLLMPGKSLCGDIELVDIGIPQRIIAACAGPIRRNAPDLWRDDLPVIDGASHKYRRGHLAVFSGPGTKTGAARLAALAGLRSGAGLVTIASPADALCANAASLTAIMLREIDGVSDLEAWLDEAKLSAFVLGPGFGVGDRIRRFALALKERPVVLDADGMTAFKDDPGELFDAFAAGEAHLVLTPHEGEFKRLFADLAEDQNLSKVERALKAAARAHAIIVYKGADSVIAAPDGRAIIDTNGPPWLATAGSGDVLAGMIGALMAQGMPAFEAAAAGVYLHGEVAKGLGPGARQEGQAAEGRGMTAEDLADRAGTGWLSLQP